MPSDQKRLRVIIVGGSVAGLTLAHSLLKSNIDFVVLESNRDIAPQVGASIGILPNGARILDQLGLFDEILDATEPMQKAFSWSGAGKLICSTEAPQILHERHGYAISFLDRQTILEILSRNLYVRQGQILTNKRVTRVEHFSDKVQVHCTDESVFEGDIVVGADGVRSTIRQEMWRHMDSVVPEQAKKERALMSSEYACVFGISTATPGLDPGQSNRTFAEGYSTLTITYTASEIPRLNNKDMEKHMEKYLHIPITDTVPLSAVYENEVSKNFLALEEAFYTHWSNDRFMTPNMGQGGNSAIESAASLANYLTTLTQGSSIDLSDIKNCLAKWQESRKPRTKTVSVSANGLTRLEAGATLKDRIITQHLLPYMSQYLVDKTSKSLMGAEKLDSIPLPPRASQCSMPLHLQSDASDDVSYVQRALWATPLLGCYFAANITMGSVIEKVIPLLGPIFRQGTWTASNGETVSLTRPIYHVSLLDKILGGPITCFLPSISGSDPRSYAQMFSFMADLGPVYGIWLLESYRQGSSGFEVLLPMLAGTAFQLKGIGKFAPLYYAIEYIRSPLSSMLHADNRGIKMTALASLLPATLAGYYLPTFANFFASTLESRRSWNAAWQLFPVVVPLLQLPFRIMAKPQTPAVLEEPKEQRRKNMFAIRCTYTTFAAISGLSFVYARFSAPTGTSLASIFLPGLHGHTDAVGSFSQGIARFLQYDQILSMASGFVWLGLRFRELKQSGAQVSWWKSTCAVLGATVTVGPGAAFALAWGWREELLARM
ncbi:unnamed protein product [Penicillium salamii]|nr:unnamed protein product [Penicillium salamii]CAG8392046.1 unnamed protein product [Penicillium salamii]